MIPLTTAEPALPIGLTGAVVLGVGLLTTLAWLWYLYR
jgi:hypothetical protein